MCVQADATKHITLLHIRTLTNHCRKLTDIQSMATMYMYVHVYPARSNCMNPCTGPECKVFTREVTVREQDSSWSGSCRKNMAVLKLIGL